MKKDFNIRFFVRNKIKGYFHFPFKVAFSVLPKWLPFLAFLVTWLSGTIKGWLLFQVQLFSDISYIDSLKRRISYLKTPISIVIPFQDIFLVPIKK